MSEAEWCPDPVPPAVDLTSCQTQSASDRYSYLCQAGWQPLLITGFLRDFLITNWSASDQIVNPILRNRLWKPTPDTGILIETTHRMRLDVIGLRPALLIKRNSVQFKLDGIGAGEAWGVGSSMFANEKGANHVHTAMVVGSHTIFCVNGTGASAESLAIETAMQTLEYAPDIRRSMDLIGFMPLDLGPAQKLKGSPEQFVIPINVGWMYQHSWNLHEVSMPLRQISLRPSFSPDGGLVLKTRFRGR